MKYDAFISYSHGNDLELAVSLQQSLQRIAKPFFKRRALNIFRDEDSLSISPELWNNIVTALRLSNFFIYIGSSSSARSYWVERELTWWLENKHINTLILINADNQSSGKLNVDLPLPKAIKTGLGPNPFYLNFRKLKLQEEYTLDNPLYKKEVIKIAAFIRGVDTKDLLSLEAKETRKAKGITYSAIVLLLCVIVLSGVYLNNSYELKETNRTSKINFWKSQANYFETRDVNKAFDLLYHIYLSQPTKENELRMSEFFQENQLYEVDSLSNVYQSNAWFVSESIRRLNDELETGDSKLNFKKFTFDNVESKVVESFGEFSSSLILEEKGYHVVETGYENAFAFSVIETDFVKNEINYLGEVPLSALFAPNIYWNNELLYIYPRLLESFVDDSYLRIFDLKKKTWTKIHVEGIGYMFNFRVSFHNDFLFFNTQDSGSSGTIDQFIYHIDGDTLNLISADYGLGAETVERNDMNFPCGHWTPLKDIINEMFVESNLVTNELMLCPSGQGVNIIDTYGNLLHFVSASNFIYRIDSTYFNEDMFYILSDGVLYGWDYGFVEDLNGIGGKKFTHHNTIEHKIHHEFGTNVLGKIEAATDEKIEIRYGKVLYTFFHGNKKPLSSNLDILKHQYKRIKFDRLSLAEKEFYGISEILKSE